MTRQSVPPGADALSIKAMGRFFASATAFVMTGFAIMTNAACSGSAPEILNTDWRITVERENGENRERLSLFCAVNDGDGIKDIEYLYLIQDRDGLDWKLTADNWRQREMDGVTWVGSDNLEHPDGPVFPRGNYRVVLIDKAGERAERDIPLQTVSTESLKVPVLKLDGTSLSFEPIPKLPDYAVLFEDRAGVTLKASGFSSKTVDLDNAWGGPSWRSSVFGVRILAFDESNKIAVRSALLETAKAGTR